MRGATGSNKWNAGCLHNFNTLLNSFFLVCLMEYYVHVYVCVCVCVCVLHIPISNPTLPLSRQFTRMSHHFNPFYQSPALTQLFAVSFTHSHTCTVYWNLPLIAFTLILIASYTIKLNQFFHYEDSRERNSCSFTLFSLQKYGWIPGHHTVQNLQNMKCIRPSVSHSTSRELLLSKASTEMYVKHIRVKIHKNGKLKKKKTIR